MSSKAEPEKGQSGPPHTRARTCPHIRARAGTQEPAQAHHAHPPRHTHTPAPAQAHSAGTRTAAGRPAYAALPDGPRWARAGRSAPARAGARTRTGEHASVEVGGAPSQTQSKFGSYP
jgi:hypothetical protein